MAESIVERVARAICKEVGADCKGLPAPNCVTLCDECRRGARAAIKAMREPTEKVWIAGRKPILLREAVGGTVNDFTLGKALCGTHPAWATEQELSLNHVTKGDCAVMVFRAMIDAVLNEETTNE